MFSENAQRISICIFLFFIALSTPLKAQLNDSSWNAAIKRVEEDISEYCEYARKVDGSCFAGSMYNGFGYGKHTCAIIARMLSINEHRDRLEQMDRPELDGKTSGHDAAVFAATLDAWVSAAKRMLGKSEDYKASVWNLDCVGRYEIGGSSYITEANTRADFIVKDGSLFIYGDIDHGFYERFVEFVASADKFSHVYLGSGGGSVRDALLAGHFIRENGWDTAIFGNCFSACPLVFIGGGKRNLWATESRLGFHQVARNELAVPKTDPIYGIIASYLTDMGVHSPTVLLWMLSAPPNDMFIPELDDVCSSGVVTWIQRVCF